MRCTSWAHRVHKQHSHQSREQCVVWVWVSARHIARPRQCKPVFMDASVNAALSSPNRSRCDANTACRAPRALGTQEPPNRHASPDVLGRQARQQITRERMRYTTSPQPPASSHPATRPMRTLCMAFSRQAPPPARRLRHTCTPGEPAAALASDVGGDVTVRRRLPGRGIVPGLHVGLDRVPCKHHTGTA